MLKEHLREVTRLGGAAVLDWHVEQFNDALLGGAARGLVEVLSELTGDETIWWTSPGRAARWWLRRRQRIADSR